jgi:hypothetical protein
MADMLFILWTMYVTDCVWTGWEMKIRAVKNDINGIEASFNCGIFWFGTKDACCNMIKARR